MFNFGKQRKGQKQDTKLYDILEVNPKATPDEIKKAWKKKSAQVHPDRHPPEKRDEMTKIQQEVNQAYEILKDPKKRELYDQIGFEALIENNSGGNEDVNGGFPEGFPFPNGFPFAGGFPFGNANHQSRTQSMDRKVKIQIKLEDIYNGGENTIKIQQKINCSKCNGIGATDSNAVKECKTCQGNGKIPKIQKAGPHHMIQTIVQCHTCNGRGKEIDKSKECPMCHGSQLIDNIKDITYNIPKGIHEGESIIIYGEANQIAGTTQKGNLHLVVEEIPSDTGLIRKGDHLLYVMEIDLADALCGFKKVIKHLDGRKLLIEHNDIIRPNDVYQVSGEGMPINNNVRFTDTYGDLIIQFEIKFPERLGNNDKSVEERKNFIRMILPKSKNLKEDDYKNDEEYEPTQLEKFNPDDKQNNQMPHGFSGFERGFVINTDGEEGDNPAGCTQQ